MGEADAETGFILGGKSGTGTAIGGEGGSGMGARVGVIAIGDETNGASVEMGASVGGGADGIVSGTAGGRGARIGVDKDMDMDALKVER